MLYVCKHIDFTLKRDESFPVNKLAPYPQRVDMYGLSREKTGRLDAPLCDLNKLNSDHIYNRKRYWRAPEQLEFLHGVCRMAVDKRCKMPRECVSKCHGTV